MKTNDTIELFTLKCAPLKLAVDASQGRGGKLDTEASVAPFVNQFSTSIRSAAEQMAEHYKLFYMLENDIRKLIDDTLSEAYGTDWWDRYAPQSAKDECKRNQQREQDAAVTARSENPLDYVSFGQLGEIITGNWILFGGILSNQKAMIRVMSGLNMLRGPIAHCGLLASDEIDRLKLTVKDWFRLLEGPKGG